MVFAALRVGARLPAVGRLLGRALTFFGSEADFAPRSFGYFERGRVGPAQCFVFAFNALQVLPALAAPALCGTCSSCLNYEQKVRLWRQAANTVPSERPSRLILRMDCVARQVCVTAGSDVISSGEGAGRLRNIPHEYFALCAVDSVYQEVAYCSRLDASSRKAESKAQRGGALREAFASILRIRIAPLPRSRKSFVLASAQSNVGCPALAEQMRRRFGCG